MSKPYRGKMSPVTQAKDSRKAIITLATTVFDSKEAAISWLSRPQFGLGDKVPFENINTPEGLEAVKSLLLRIEHGVLS